MLQHIGELKQSSPIHYYSLMGFLVGASSMLALVLVNEVFFASSTPTETPTKAVTARTYDFGSNKSSYDFGNNHQNLGGEFNGGYTGEMK